VMVELELLVAAEEGLLMAEEELLEIAVPFTLLIGDTSVPVGDAWPVPLMLPVGLKEPDECGMPEPRMLPDGLNVLDGLTLPDGLKVPDWCANPVPVSICTPVPLPRIVLDPPVGKGVFDEPVTMTPRSEWVDEGRLLPDACPYE